MKASLFLASCLTASAKLTSGNKDNVGTTSEKTYMAMNPEHVAILLRDTQQEWVDFALNEKSDVAEKNMVDSCAIVAQGMVDGSDGDKDRVEEYFREVCSVGKGAQQDNCQNFAQGLLAFLTNDPEANRNSLDARSFCNKFWSEHMSTYVQTAEARRAAEAEKKRQEQDDMIAAQKRSFELAKQKAQEETKRQDAIRLANLKKINDAKVKAETETAEKKAQVLRDQAHKTEKTIKKVETPMKKAADEVKADSEKKIKKAAVTENTKSKTFGEIASDKFRNFVNYYFTRSTAVKKFQAKTMADVFRKESTYLVHRGHGDAIHKYKRVSNNFFFGKKKTVGKDNKAISPEEAVKAEAKAIVAQKVQAIKKRIAMKFAAARKEKKGSSDNMKASTK